MDAKFETYSFSHTDENGITINLSFTVPATGLTIGTYHEMCRKFAATIGYVESSITRVFGAEDERFLEEFLD